MKKKSTANWQGTGKEGSGTLSTTSKALNQIPYTWKDRFADGIGTNPEELIAAAHAGCFTMKLTFVLANAGFTADKLETSCEIDLVDGTIITSHLTLTGTIKGITQEQFEKCADEAKTTCPVSKLLNAKITLETRLS